MALVWTMMISIFTYCPCRRDELEVDVLAGGWISCEGNSASDSFFEHMSHVTYHSSHLIPVGQTAIGLRNMTPTGTAFAWSNIKCVRSPSYNAFM